jgi:hypothetical protein
MYDSFSEGRVFYVRAFEIMATVVALAALAHL